MIYCWDALLVSGMTDDSFGFNVLVRLVLVPHCLSRISGLLSIGVWSVVRLNMWFALKVSSHWVQKTTNRKRIQLLIKIEWTTIVIAGMRHVQNPWATTRLHCLILPGASEFHGRERSHQAEVPGSQVSRNSHFLWCERHEAEPCSLPWWAECSGTPG